MTQGSNPDRLRELMNGEIDGTNTDDQSRELDDTLTADPRAREEFDALRRLSRRLDAVEEVDPPAHLIHRIISAIPFGRHGHAARSDTGGGIRSWLVSLLPRPSLRYAATFAVGLIAGVALLWAATNRGHVDGSLDISNLYGTMRAIDTSDGFEVVGSVGIDTEEVRGEVRLHESDRKLLAEVSLVPEAQIEWVLHYDADEVAFEGFRQLEGRAGTFNARGAEMRVGQDGSGRYLLLFTETNGGRGPMSIEIFSDNKLLFNKDLGV
jgi:hypothetical protein